MKILQIKRLAILFVAAVALLPACKSSEKNYREAYERAMAGRDGTDSGLDSTIYGKMRRDFSLNRMVVNGDTVDVKSQHVRVTADGGGIAESLHRYSVVAAQFKQIFTAKAMRQRLFEAGYPAAFIVETAEPYYYVVTGSYDDVAEAVKAMHRLAADDAFTLKPPLPYILERPQRR